MSSKTPKIIKDFEEYTTTRGLDIKVYAIPNQIIRNITPEEPKPRKPTITMEIKVGGKTKPQIRPVKESDPEWDEFQDRLEIWEDQKDDLQEAVTFCLALKDIGVPLDPRIEEFSDGFNLMHQTGILSFPINIWLRKYLWLQDSVISQHDEYNINMIIQKLSGIPEDIIEEMKANFRNTLLGKNTEELVESDIA